MERYQVILTYDGTDLVGSQRQTRHRTVQGEFEKALCRLGWIGRSVLMAGRTDTGVHAIGQTVAFDLDWLHTPDELCAALNANLPADVAVRVVRIAPSGFHPRFDATSRRYLYRLFCQGIRDPLRERFAWRVWPAVDGRALPALAQIWIGTHDFAAFGSPPQRGRSTMRKILRSSWLQHDDEWWFEIQADAFLYRMVRRLVYIQVVVAQGRIPSEAILRALSGQADLPAGLAPAHGLTLMEVVYPSFDVL